MILGDQERTRIGLILAESFRNEFGDVDQLIHGGVFGTKPKLFVRNCGVLVCHFDQPGQDDFFENLSDA
jgi:hypothetical protein